MINDDFLAKCRSLDPSSAIDREKNREIIKTRLEEENVIVIKNKRIRRPALVAAVLIGVLSLSVVAYAAVPVIWRYFDTQVVQGEEFVRDLWVAETDLPDGTTSMGSFIDIDREALDAAGGGAVIVEVDGDKWVVLDELHLDNMEDGLALLQLENLVFPSFVPEGFAFDRFTFPVNPNIHQYQMGTIPASKHAAVYFSDDYRTIRLQIMQIRYRPDAEVGLAVPVGPQSLLINGNTALMINGSISDTDIAKLEGVEWYDSSTDWEGYTTSVYVGSAAPETVMRLMMIIDGVGYSISAEGVSMYDLVKMAASMR